MPKTSWNRSKTVKRAFTGFRVMEMLKLTSPGGAGNSPRCPAPRRDARTCGGRCDAPASGGHARLRLRAAAALFPDRPRLMHRAKGAARAWPTGRAPPRRLPCSPAAGRGAGGGGPRGSGRAAGRGSAGRPALSLARAARGRSAPGPGRRGVPFPRGGWRMTRSGL